MKLSHIFKDIKDQFKMKIKKRFLIKFKKNKGNCMKDYFNKLTKS